MAQTDTATWRDLTGWVDMGFRDRGSKQGLIEAHKARGSHMRIEKAT